ncbi:hypothetical protein BT93_I0232 [Corymbia citriodora subsp. variegata]|nr:hypothetical protein BT93_I0232 [Corymbia citriodora subsp. variegata]
MSNESRQIYILKEAGIYVNSGDITSRARAGVEYKDKKKKYWVDENNRDCFEIYARGLDITLSDRPIYWQWKKPGGDSNGVEVAELVKTKWLEVKGSFWTTGYLTHGAPYKISFKVMLTPSSNLKNERVNMKLSCPDGTTQEGPVTMPEDNQWHELEVGRFNMNERNAGEMRFAMAQSFKKWGKGLIIKSVEIKAI